MKHSRLFEVGGLNFTTSENIKQSDVIERSNKNEVKPPTDWSLGNVIICSVLLCQSARGCFKTTLSNND